jgi:hypothetical protein
VFFRQLEIGPSYCAFIIVSSSDSLCIISFLLAFFPFFSLSFLRVLLSHSHNDIVLGRALWRSQRLELYGLVSAALFCLPTPVRVDNVHGAAALEVLGAGSVGLVGSVTNNQIVLGRGKYYYSLLRVKDRLR